ncbi:NADPH:quinone reductase [Streptomyces sp. NBC_01314]|uniref:NADPH:quinone reductase n=1 Tax=Streptomyces sp. NBC_01314 TaxID=2903821 RepID=UPI0030867B01|nr:NADPH:quinone reductase [Streptomyces sp. NBC_01314]
MLRIVDLPMRDPGAGEVRVKIQYSGVNPTDWKTRIGGIHMPIPDGQVQVPHLDGSGIVDAVGPGVEGLVPGDRVWLWLVAFKRLEGTAQEYATVPVRLVRPLPDTASLELGASLGVPFITAHHALTLRAGGPAQLAPGVLAGVTVLVAGGAGAVGNAAIQLATWAGATVITTVSSEAKARLAKAAGAAMVVNYRTQDAAAEIRRLAPGGVDIVVEVSPSTNVGLDLAVLAPHGLIVVYANNGGDDVTMPVRSQMTLSVTWHFVLLYKMTDAVLDNAVASIDRALAAGVIGVGEDRGLPVHHYPLERIADAHRAVESGTVGKVLLDLSA